MQAIELRKIVSSEYDLNVLKSALQVGFWKKGFVGRLDSEIDGFWKIGWEG